MRIPVLIIFLKIKVTNQVLKLGANEDQWEILPYHLAFARKVPSAIAINVDPFIATEEQDCANDMAISTSSPITLYKFMPMGKPHIFIILEDQRVFDFDATKENLVLASENNGENWPNSIINSMGVFFSNHFVTSGGTYSVSSRRGLLCQYNNSAVAPVRHRRSAMSMPVDLEIFTLLCIYRQTCMQDSKDQWGRLITNVHLLFMAMLEELLLWSPISY